ncbi:ATP-binding protein [Deinobacterium chartae]|nr:ATP-binding protein [Deinobacterium chartae]
MFSPLQINPEVELVFETPRHVPALHTDEGKVAQILRNYISNALKFTAQGQVLVQAAYDAVSDTVTFEVQDTGVGIAPEDQPRLFQEFEQLDHPLPQHTVGTGLGLSLAKRLAELLGGTVGVRSEPGVGSVFSVTLPRCTRADTTQDAPPPALCAPPPPPAAQPRTLLIIDNSETDRYLLRTQLRAQPWQILEADSGPRGLALIGEQRPDAVLLDLMMPGMTGFEVFSALRAEPATRDLPVIVVTSKILNDGELQRLEGVRAILPKSVSAAALIETLLRSFSRSPES